MAALWALAWIRRAWVSNLFGHETRFELWADSLIALDIANADARARAEPCAGQAIRAHTIALAPSGGGAGLRLEHVPGHAGHPWNEVVDALA